METEMSTDKKADALILMQEAVKKNQVIKLNVTDQAIAEMKQQYMGLTVAGLEDKEGLKVVYAARQEVKRTRVGVQKYADDLKRSAIDFQNKVNTEKKRVVTELETIEAHLQAEEDKIAAIKKEIEDKKQREEEERIQKRIDALAEYGFGVEYAIIKSVDEKTFETLLAAAKQKKAEEDKLKEEEEQRRKEKEIQDENDRQELERLRIENEEAKRKLKQQVEEQRMERVGNRLKIIEGLGLVEMGYKYSYNLYPDCTITSVQIGEMTNEDFNVAVENIRTSVSLRKDEEEKEKARLIEETRLKAIQDKEEAEALKKQQEEEKLAMASDKVKFQEVIKQLQAIKIPAMKSNKAKHAASSLHDMLEKTIVELQKVMSIK